MGQRNIVITGVNRGLGRELAQVFVENGDQVFGTFRTGALPTGLAGSVAVDLADEQSIVTASAEITTLTSSVDLLINCAGADARSFGAPAGQRGPFDLDADVFNAVINTNATGPLLLTRHLLPLLQAGNEAMVVNVSSQLGSMKVAADFGSDTAYCVSKAALNMVSVKTAAALRPDGIGVVMLHPGWLNTDMGGPNAALDAADTSRVIAGTIDALSFADSGRFIQWDGTDHAF
jgi:NAD(P)-dependent dehydrogenase (short-subunit alcohol dehydrogenase family)